MTTYRSSAAAALLLRPSVPEDCYIVQYVAADGGCAPAAAGGAASLSIRFVGRPVVDERDKGRVRSFEYARAPLPAFLSRLVGTRVLPAPAAAAAGAAAVARVLSVVVLGDESTEVEGV